MRCARHYSQPSPLPIQIVRAVPIWRQSAPRSSALPTRSPARRAKCAVPPRASWGCCRRPRGSGTRFPAGPRTDPCSGGQFRGTVPSDVQPPTLFVGALTKNSQQPDIAIALLHFLLFRGRSRNHESRIGAICGALRLDHRPTHGHCSMVRSGGWHHALGSERSTQRSDRAQFSSGTAHFSISAIGNQTRHPGRSDDVRS